MSRSPRFVPAYRSAAPLPPAGTTAHYPTSSLHFHRQCHACKAGRMEMWKHGKDLANCFESHQLGRTDKVGSPLEPHDPATQERRALTRHLVLDHLSGTRGVAVFSVPLQTVDPTVISYEGLPACTPTNQGQEVPPSARFRLGDSRTSHALTARG
jgi:hypothetical protein